MDFHRFTCLLSSPAAADDCLRNQGHVLSIFSGSDGNDLVKFESFSSSRRESFSKTANKYVWCIEADRQNLNIAEFKWGDVNNKCKYLCTLIEPGRGAAAPKFDGSKNIQPDRIIGFSRKNRDEGGSITTQTISSQKLGSGYSISGAALVPIQVNELDLREFMSDEGTVQIDRLSNNFDAFARFLKEEKREVVSGGELTVTLPANSSVARALGTNKYDKYSASDFVRATTSFTSLVRLNNGSPTLLYFCGITPEKGANMPAFSSLVSESQITIKVTPTTNSSFPFPTSEPIHLKEEGIHSLGTVKLDGSISYASTKLEVAVSNVVVGTFDVSSFAPKN